jgi:hypothetical protein
MAAKTGTDIDRGVKDSAARSTTGSMVELFGHVTLIQGYNLASYVGCHALVALRDTPGKTVAVLTSEPRLQSLLESGLSTGKLVAFWGHRLRNPTAPLGGTWTVDVYGIDSVILHGAT